MTPVMTAVVVDGVVNASTSTPIPQQIQNLVLFCLIK